MDKNYANFINNQETEAVDAVFVVEFDFLAHIQEGWP